MSFSTDQVGVIKLGKYVEDVEINAPFSDVEFGAGSETLFVAPVNIQCSRIIFNADKLTVEKGRAEEYSFVYLQCAQLIGGEITSTPTGRGDVALAVTWPGAKAHPWNTFSSDPTSVTDARTSEGLRRFRKFVTAFRSHNKGSLARYKHKLEHERMTKGAGRAVLDALVSEGILSLHGAMYYLDPDRLGEVTGAKHSDAVAQRYEDRTVLFIESAVKMRTRLGTQSAPEGNGGCEEDA